MIEIIGKIVFRVVCGLITYLIFIRVYRDLQEKMKNSTRNIVKPEYHYKKYALPFENRERENEKYKSFYCLCEEEELQDEQIREIFGYIYFNNRVVSRRGAEVPAEQPFYREKLYINEYQRLDFEGFYNKKEK